MCAAQPDFTADEIERGRSYHRPLYRLFFANAVLGVGVLAALAFSPAGDRLFAELSDLAWWARGLLLPALVVLIGTALRLPLAFWRGYVHEHRFGLSTQSVGNWLADWAKSLLVGATLTALALFALVASARWLDGAWPAVAAPGAAGLVVVLGFLGPVALEPLFNRFRPLQDDRLQHELRSLASRAGVPIREVLVADASRRTRKQNAYVSGLGRTRRVVLYDTLLDGSEPNEVQLVTAHELAHRRERHVAKGTALGATGAAVFVSIVWWLLSWPALLSAIGASGADDPRVAPLVLLSARLLSLLTLAPGAALSRRWEREADRISLELTGDLAAFESIHRRLAHANLADLYPPRAMYILLFSHPSAPERLAAARTATV